MTSASTLLCARNISKTFPGLVALDSVDFAVGTGEIVALVGQNGSGKSTLVKILTGVYEADSGGRVEVTNSTGAGLLDAAARDHIHVIHQDLGLIAQLNTVENLSLGRGGLRPADRRAELRAARDLVARFDADFDVMVPVGTLSPAERAIVAIARALDGWTAPDGILILDEPTAPLHDDEVGRLFTAVRRVASEGAGVVFVSHRLDEVMDLADRVVVLRDGRLVADTPVRDLRHEELVRLIVGGVLTESSRRRSVAGGAINLQAEDVAGGTVACLDLELRAGEVVGLAGILGSGREHSGALLFGALDRDRGSVVAGGRLVPAANPAAAIAAGMAFVPGDRRAAGAVMTMCVRENLTLPDLRRLRRGRGTLDRSAERTEVDEWMARVELRPAEPERPLELFSGGNQQKVVLAKWLRNDPRVLLLDEPTQGVDVGAKAAIYALIDEATTRGAAVLVASSDTAELAAICDRVLVLREGRVCAEIAGDELTEERLVLESLGLHDTTTRTAHA